MKKLIVIGIGLALFAASCGGKAVTQPTVPGGPTATASPHESAGDALKRQLGFEFKGQYGRSWDELHPGQQALVPREKYVDCARKDPASDISVDVIETYADPIEIMGGPETTSTAVTIKLTADVDGSTINMTLHEVLIAGEWHWVLPDDAIVAFQAGGCPND